VLAERSFENFSTRYCVVGHTHVPVIFQQPYDIAQDDFSQEPTVPLEDSQVGDSLGDEDDEDTAELVAVRPTQQTNQSPTPNQSASLRAAADAADALAEVQQKRADDEPDLPAAQQTPQEAKATSTEDQEPLDMPDQPEHADN